MRVFYVSLGSYVSTTLSGPLKMEGVGVLFGDEHRRTKRPMMHSDASAYNNAH